MIVLCVVSIRRSAERFNYVKNPNEAQRLVYWVLN